MIHTQKSCQASKKSKALRFVFGITLSMVLLIITSVSVSANLEPKNHAVSSTYTGERVWKQSIKDQKFTYPQHRSAGFVPEQEYASYPSVNAEEQGIWVSEEELQDNTLYRNKLVCKTRHGVIDATHNAERILVNKRCLERSGEKRSGQEKHVRARIHRVKAEKFAWSVGIAQTGKTEWRDTYRRDTP